MVTSSAVTGVTTTARFQPAATALPQEASFATPRWDKRARALVGTPTVFPAEATLNATAGSARAVRATTA